MNETNGLNMTEMDLTS